MPEQEKIKYGLYDKEGNFICWRMTKRIKNEYGKYDVITARSKKSERDCRKKLEELIKEYYLELEDAKKRKPHSEMPFGEFADRWYRLNIELADCSDVNKLNYKGYVYKHIIPYFGEMRLCDITEDDCQIFMNKFLGYSKIFASKVRMTLRRIFKKAVKQKLIADNPADDIVLPKTVVNTRRPITEEERKMILRTAEWHYAGPMVLTMLYCGLRPVEIRRMTWKWIDFEKNTITVGKSKTKAGTGRILPMPPQLKTALAKQKLKGLSQTWVFTRPKSPDKQMDTDAFYSAWQNFIREMDIENGAEVYRNKIVNSVIAEDLTPYLLRHTFCTDCQAAGVPINVAKELMGHADISVTAKIYTHMTDEVFEMNRKRLEEFAEEKKKNADMA